MTRTELLALGKDPPVRMADGSFGLLIRLWSDGAGVQVMGEEAIRTVPYACLVALGGGALTEVPPATERKG